MLEESLKQKEINISGIISAINRRKKISIIIAITVFTLNGLWAWNKWTNDRKYTGSLSFLITDPLSKSAGNMPSRGAPISNQLFEDLAFNTTSTNVPMYIELLKSPGILKKFADENDIETWRLRENLEIKAVGGSSGGGGGLAALKGGGADEPGILKITLTSDNPVKGQKLLENLSIFYLNLTQDQRQKRLSDGLKFLNEQAPSLKISMNEIQTKISDFRDTHSLVDPIRQGGYIKSRENRMLENIDNIENQRTRLQQVRKEILRGNVAATRFNERVGDGKAGASLQINDIDQSMLQQLLRVETELGSARSKYRADSEMVKGLTSRLENLRPMLLSSQLDAVDTALKLNSLRLKNAKAQSKSINNEFKKNDNLIREFEILQSELNIARSKMAGIENAREKFRLKMAQSSVPWSVLNPPYMNPEPISPDPTRDVIVGGVLALVIGATTGYLLDRRENTFHDPMEASTALNLPLLTHISHFSELNKANINSKFTLRDPGRDSNLDNENRIAIYDLKFEKTFRRLYTLIRNFARLKPFRMIVISSSTESEGKSLINTLLAKTISDMGYRILLIDANLRRPKLHSWLELKNEKGLSELLNDETAEWKEFIQHVDGHESWSVITTGQPVTDPTLLFSTSRMKNLIRDLESSEQFDHIIFDTPPDLEYADFSLIAENCDGVIAMVSLERVKQDLARETIRRIKESKVPLMGIVTNSISKNFEGSDTNNIIYSISANPNINFSEKLRALWRKLRNLQQQLNERLNN